MQIVDGWVGAARTAMGGLRLQNRDMVGLAPQMMEVCLQQGGTNCSLGRTVHRICVRLGWRKPGNRVRPVNTCALHKAASGQGTSGQSAYWVLKRWPGMSRVPISRHCS
jgi:hypothetical protein